MFIVCLYIPYSVMAGFDTYHGPIRHFHVNFAVGPPNSAAMVARLVKYLNSALFKFTLFKHKSHPLTSKL